MAAVLPVAAAAEAVPLAAPQVQRAVPKAAAQLAVLEQTREARKAVARPVAAAQLVVPKRMQAECRAVAAQLAEPEQMLVARKAVARRAVVPRADKLGLWVAAPRVVLAVTRRLGAEPLAVAARMAHKAAARKTVVLAAA